MNLFSFVKSHLLILEVISEYATLKKAGLYFKGVCPFHQEKTASFTVSPHKGIFYCFGCHLGGDVISFIEKAENCSALEAAQFLADRYELEIPEELQKKEKLQTTVHVGEKKRYHALCKLTAEWCHERLLKSPAVSRYLKQRKIDEPFIKQFSIGYFPGGLASVKALTEFAQQHGYLLDDLLNANILVQGKSVLYSPFEDRIIFPIKDHLGRFSGFGGRVFKKADERPKYYNSKENSYFLKGSLLFGLDSARTHIQQDETVFLVEGYTDCLAMVQHGFNNTVATLGTACTLEHLKILARYAQVLFVLYDGDQAGKNAMLRLTELCWQVDVELKVIQLPEKEDPASFLTAGKDLKPLIEQASDIFIFFIDSTAEDFLKKGLQQKVSIIRSFLSKIDNIQESLKQELLLQRAAKTFDISLSSLKKELYRLRNSHVQVIRHSKQKPTEKDPLPNQINTLKEIPLLEKKLFSVIINNVHLMHSEDEEYLQKYLSLPLQKVLKKIQKTKVKTQSLDFTQFFNILQEEEKLLISQLVLECQEYEGPENFEYLLAQFQKRTWKLFVTDTKEKLERARLDQNTTIAQKVLLQFQELKKRLLHKGLI